MADHPAPTAAVPPLTPGFGPNLKFDLLSGFLVFLIAMPLCLGIARASEFPPIAGIWTAVIGGLLTTFLSNSQLTIKGPAAGLIVVVAMAVVDLGQQAVPALPAATEAAMRADGKGDEAVHKELQVQQLKAGYPLALGCALAAGVLQALLGLFRAGTLGELVPLTPVHGMLAAIGITIMAKQFFPMLGITPAPPSDWTPIEVIGAIPGALAHINGTVAVVGLLSLAILIAFPYLKAAVPALKPVPAQVVVLAVGIPLAMALGLPALLGDAGRPKFMVVIPDILADPAGELPNAFHWPVFDALLTGLGVKTVVMFCLVASIESLLSAQAIDLIDPWKRKTNMNRDLLACGAANTLCAAVGALPMISEIVRSKANIDNGARTKSANFFHAGFLLAFVLLLPAVINTIPTAALGAMLVFVGFRLASPREFVHMWTVGPEQLAVFLTTIVVTLSTDLLIGVLSGVALKMVLHAVNGAPITAMLRPQVETRDESGVTVVRVKRAAVFSTWLGLKWAIERAAEGKPAVVVDLSETRLVDHSVMEKLHALEHEFKDAGKLLTLRGLEGHTSLSTHPAAARRRSGGVPASPKDSGTPMGA